jgi:hypothetical protein
MKPVTGYSLAAAGGFVVGGVVACALAWSLYTPFAIAHSLSAVQANGHADRPVSSADAHTCNAERAADAVFGTQAPALSLQAPATTLTSPQSATVHPASASSRPRSAADDESAVSISEHDGVSAPQTSAITLAGSSESDHLLQEAEPARPAPIAPPQEDTAADDSAQDRVPPPLPVQTALYQELRMKVLSHESEATFRFKDLMQLPEVEQLHPDHFRALQDDIMSAMNNGTFHPQRELD